MAALVECYHKVMSISGFDASVTEYARGKMWYWYLPLWLFGVYVFWQLFVFDMAGQQMPAVLIVPYSFNFVMHELAHIFTAFLPPVLTASAGSGSELLLGAVLVVMAFWQRSYFASLFSALWLALACQSAGQYMADAIPRRIPLVSLGGALSGQDAVHDWHFVFGQLHLLDASYFIGGSLRFIGMLAASLGLLFTAWLLYKMAITPASIPADTTLATPQPADSPIKPETVRDSGFTSLPLNDRGPEPPSAV